MLAPSRNGGSKAFLFVIASALMLISGDSGSVKPSSSSVSSLIKDDSCWTPPHYNTTVISAFKSKLLENPFPVPEKDPYRLKINTSRVGVCGVKYLDSDRLKYELNTYPSSKALDEAASKAPGRIYLTHTGPCGLCSTLQDLSAYMQYKDMTSPVRKCGFKGFVSQKWAMKCLSNLGLTEPCAKIWFYNTRNTRKECLGTCLRNVNAPYNKPDGSLNDCLQCDEDKSGPVFKKVAARTRRDSGLESAIKRPPESISHVNHYYY